MKKKYILKPSPLAKMKSKAERACKVDPIFPENSLEAPLRRIGNKHGLTEAEIIGNIMCELDDDDVHLEGAVGPEDYMSFDDTQNAGFYL